MKIFNFFNVRTFFVLIISQLAAFLAIHFNIKFNIDLLLFGLAIVFPLNFSIQAAFKRRDRALEYFSSFKAATISLYYSIQIASDLPREKKDEGREILKGMVDMLVKQLENRMAGYELFQRKLDDLFSFIDRNREEISNRNVLRMIRYIRDIAEGSAYLISLITHRTMIGLRFYSLFFIAIFPFLEAPILLYRLESIVPLWVIYTSTAITSLTLITLANFQKMIEYPFDQKGADRIRVDEFKLNI